MLQVSEDDYSEFAERALESGIEKGMLERENLDSIFTNSKIKVFKNVYCFCKLLYIKTDCCT